MKIVRNSWSVVSRQESEKEELQAILNLSPQKKSAVITFLRESYYGQQATTGRLQRIFEVSKQK